MDKRLTEIDRNEPKRSLPVTEIDRSPYKGGGQIRSFGRSVPEGRSLGLLSIPQAATSSHGVKKLEGPAASIPALKARVRALREIMQASRLDYLRAQHELHLLQGDAEAADRYTRQIRNLLNAERPKRSRKAGSK